MCWRRQYRTFGLPTVPRHPAHPHAFAQPLSVLRPSISTQTRIIMWHIYVIRSVIIGPLPSISTRASRTSPSVWSVIIGSLAFHYYSGIQHIFCVCSRILCKGLVVCVPRPAIISDMLTRLILYCIKYCPSRGPSISPFIRSIFSHLWPSLSTHASSVSHQYPGIWYFLVCLHLRSLAQSLLDLGPSFSTQTSRTTPRIYSFPMRIQHIPMHLLSRHRVFDLPLVPRHPEHFLAFAQLLTRLRPSLCG